MDRKLSSPFILPKVNLRPNLLMKKSTFDNYTKYTIMKTILNPITMVNFIWGTTIRLDITQMQNYTIGILKIMEHKHKVAR